MIRRSLVVAGFGLASGLPGCYAEPCWQSFTCSETPEEEELSCDPSVGGVRDECPGVFVSGVKGNDDSAGTRDKPMGTLSAAINAAQSGTRRIYACAETFTESVVLPTGIEVWGGLDCAQRWGYIGENSKTTIRPDAGLIPLRVVAGSGRATVADIRAEAAHATQASGSSIAVVIGTNAAVDILRSELIAGNGGRGAHGAPGGTTPAPDGDAGAPGAAACSTSTVQGGAGAINSCRGFDSVGGTGGSGNATVGGDGTKGTPEPYPNPSGAGLGGVGGDLCKSGEPGMWGAQGANGLGAVHTWGISDLGWAGPSGQDGADGRPGQGGGGGGGSRAGAAFCGSAMGGASGGGGGAGGCGGAGGKGGGAGGASIGVLSLSSDVTIRSTSIKTGRGGDGGNGGLRQVGGLRGVGGLGGNGVNLSPEGCKGGDGGDGGDGGNGGGGLGGPSVGILFPFGISPLHDADIRTSDAGKGGLGGDPNVPGSAGQDGVRADSLGVPPQ